MMAATARRRWHDVSGHLRGMEATLPLFAIIILRLDRISETRGGAIATFNRMNDGVEIGFTSVRVGRRGGHCGHDRDG